MNKLQQLTCASVASLAFVEQAFASIDPGQKNIHQGVVGIDQSAPDAVQNILAYCMGFLFILAFFYALYGGFLMLTAGSSDDNVKKGRKVLIHAIIGLIVIYLAKSIVSFVFSGLSGN